LVGVLIGSFGAFWMGEGLGFHWPGGDLAILGLAGALLITSLLLIVVLRCRTRPAPKRAWIQTTELRTESIRRGRA